jgi:hypothetical protein
MQISTSYKLIATFNTFGARDGDPKTIYYNLARD